MFGYVTPYTPELKVRDYEKFKSYYCGLCIAIKNTFGNIPRVALNYDMTFLAILLDSLDDTPVKFEAKRCIIKPAKKRPFVVNNKSLNYSALCNVALAYYKTVDDRKDDKTLKSLLSNSVFSLYIKKDPTIAPLLGLIYPSLERLSNLENASTNISIDQLSHEFGDLTGNLISSYSNDTELKSDLYDLGYNLGKWIYIIDAWDDLKEDMADNKYNALNHALNHANMECDEFKEHIKPRVSFLLTQCSSNALTCLNKLPLIKNKELVFNIINLGLLNKMDELGIGGVE